MKIVIDVKNNRKAIRPDKNNIVLFDGKEWYITTKEDLFKEYDTKFASKIAECDVKMQEMQQLKVELAAQMLEYGEIIREIVLKEKDK